MRRPFYSRNPGDADQAITFDSREYIGSALHSLTTSSSRNFKATKRCSFYILGLVDQTHPAAQLLDDAVVLEEFARSLR
jgi:hypothetical protein